MGVLLNHVGTKVIETERLILRPFKVWDAEDMYNNWASDEEVTRYLTWPTHKTIETTKRTIESWTNDYSNNQNYNWAIELKETCKVIGSMSLMNIDNRNENCEVGYCISRKLWGQEITTEAFKAVIKLAFNEVGFERITGRHDIENVASGKVMEKCGLQYEGVLRKINKNNKGILVDCKYYSILKEEL
jgi:Acetyltransferases, including N-acetylases of ribosomal proteins